MAYAFFSLPSPIMIAVFLFTLGEGMQSTVVTLLLLPLLKMSNTLRGEGKGAVIELSIGEYYIDDFLNYQ
jgi:hypothetical protein